jgi:hypothetical protein
MSSSRLAFDADGRTVVVVTTPSLWLRAGERFLVLDLFELGFTRPGRPPSPEEMLSARNPYDPESAKRARRERREIPDELLDDEEAIRQAMLEQRREPVHLVSRVAA